ncbi:MAG TPA: hypothetical protein VHC97_02650 [Thermoanaerobaculia bacterium]|jgi:hypothetical protein|nr:hypothetical protein [Thermoanaerobaculia bacterium]
MNRSLSKLVLYLLTFLLAAAVAAQEAIPPVKPVPGEGAAGEWLGALDVGPVKLRLALRVEKKDDGSLSALLDSIDQKAKIPVLRAALAAAKNPDHEVRSLPGLNHLFQHAGTGSIEEYGAIEETFAPEALATIGDWIAARSTKKRSPAVTR